MTRIFTIARLLFRSRERLLFCLGSRTLVKVLQPELSEFVAQLLKSQERFRWDELLGLRNTGTTDYLKIFIKLTDNCPEISLVILGLDTFPIVAL